jgi:translation initiation factor 2 subunit 2
LQCSLNINIDVKGNNEPAEVGQATNDSLLADFSDLKKKKKKKATFDLDDVEETKPAPPPEEDDAPIDDLDNLDDEDLGDDPFAVASGPGLEGNGEVEPWHGTDRDYTYAEVRCRDSIYLSHPIVFF